MIEWTESTWNPLVGCSRVSEGCRHCYAERQAFRAAAMGISRYDGITKKVGDEIRWTGKVALVESALELPLRWKKPRRIFVNSMSDLFHEKVGDDWLRAIFGVMWATGQHTFQVLTKRPERMQEWVKILLSQNDRAGWLIHGALKYDVSKAIGKYKPHPAGGSQDHPLPNVWLGVSVEDQATADERIPLLLQTPAAVRWVSYEPALGPVSFFGPDSPTWNRDASLDWIVVGGESGPGARPFDIAWARSTIAQGRAAGVPVFCKQLGAYPLIEAATGSGPEILRRQHALDSQWPGGTHFGNPTRDPAFNGRVAILKDRKGGDWMEWPEDLKVREYPA
jgi:protein gp37